jgi:YegS/Rv2252/BmrU family lipid kinase
MSDKKKVLFIINPRSGHGKGAKTSTFIKQHIDNERIEYEIQYTKYAKHAKQLSAQYKNDCDAIVAVGGDGSVHEVGCELIGTKTALGIIPVGSGNGIARHFNISLKTSQAIKTINHFKPNYMDTGMVNEHKFIGFCGFGFDAHIAKCFTGRQKRGFWGYAKIVAAEYKKFDNTTTQISLNGKSQSIDYFILNVFNINQYGNNLIISPTSNANDAHFELIAIRKIPFWKILANWHKFTQGKIQHIKEYKCIKFSGAIEIDLKNSDLQIDGEYLGTVSGKQNVKINPNSLKILI